MAYDESLAQRVRDELASAPELAEIKMFGGLCFTIRGNMCVGVLGDELVVRFPREQHEEIVSQPGVRPMDLTKRAMTGFALVSATSVRTARDLRRWVQRCRAHAEGLPPKATGRRARPPRVTRRR